MLCTRLNVKSTETLMGQGKKKGFEASQRSALRTYEVIIHYLDYQHK